MSDIKTICLKAFEDKFGTKPQMQEYAPGRVNIIGEHTDYNGGFVLPCAIKYGTCMVAKENGTNKMRILAVDMNNDYDEFEIASKIEKHPSKLWVNYLRGVTYQLAQKFGDKVKGLELGADDYLTKPVSLKFLKARIESFLQRNTSSLQNANLAAPSQTPSVGGTHYTKEEQKFILRCKEIIDKNLREENFGVDFMASELGMSHSAFYKKVKAITGKSAVDMIVEYRIFKAVEMMRNGETHVTKISELCGFNDIRSFRSAFRARIGMAPKQFLQQI